VVGVADDDVVWDADGDVVGDALPPPPPPHPAMKPTATRRRTEPSTRCRLLTARSCSWCPKRRLNDAGLRAPFAHGTRGSRACSHLRASASNATHQRAP